MEKAEHFRALRLQQMRPSIQIACTAYFHRREKESRSYGVRL